MNIILAIKNITKVYNSFTALSDISFDLYKGEIFTLLGVNGAGKTTLSSILATLHPPTSGNILFKQKSIYQSIPEFRKIIGYCPQKPNLNPLLTCYDNLVCAGNYFGIHYKESLKKLDHLDSFLGIHKYAHHYPPTLSGGWKQRFLIARTLMHSPKIVIFDEPTVGLDPDVRHRLWKCINYLREEGTTIILTTHYLDEAEFLSDRVCLLQQGKITHIDTPKNLLTTFGKKKLEDVFLHITQEKDPL